MNPVLAGIRKGWSGLLIVRETGKSGLTRFLPVFSTTTVPIRCSPQGGVSDDEKTHSGTTGIARRSGRGEIVKSNFRSAAAPAAAVRGYEGVCSALAEGIKPNEYKPERLTAGL